jgi:hypothetical protein
MTTNLLLVYRATFRLTFKEMRAGTRHYRIVVPVVAANLVAAYFVANFLRETGWYKVHTCIFDYHLTFFSVGPTKPHTFENKEWDEAIIKNALKNRANPISGISSKYSKHAQKAE